MEVDDRAWDSRNIAKQELKQLSILTYDWPKTNFQIIDVTELCNVRFNIPRERITLIINIKNQWNLMVKNEEGKLYLGYTDKKIRDDLKRELVKNKLKVVVVLKINNDETSALISATIINKLLDESKLITATVVKKYHTSEIRLELENCLRLIRGTRDKINMLHGNNSVEVQHSRCSEKKVTPNPFSDVKAPIVSAAPQILDSQAGIPALNSLINPNQKMQFSEFYQIYQIFKQHSQSTN